jgi:hypothetical protein
MVKKDVVKSTIEGTIDGAKFGIWAGILVGLIAFASTSVASALGFMTWDLFKFVGISFLMTGLTVVVQYALGGFLLSLLSTVSNIDIKHLHIRYAIAGVLGFGGLAFFIGKAATPIVDAAIAALIVAGALAVFVVALDSQLKTKLVVKKAK